METTIRINPFIAEREDLLAQDKAEDKKNLVEGLEETHLENISREEIENMTREERLERCNKLMREFRKAQKREDRKRAWELVEESLKAQKREDRKQASELELQFHQLCTQREELLEEILKAHDRGDWKRARELRSQHEELWRSWKRLDDLRKEEERKIQEDAERIKKETEIISQKPDSEPQVVRAAEFVRNMTGDILEQKENLQLKTTGLGKTSGVKKEHILSNALVKETCRDVKIYLTQVSGLVLEKIHSLPEDVRKKLDSLMASFQKLLKGMWRLLVIVLILYELEKMIVSFKVDGAYISHKKGRLKYGFEMAAMLVLRLSHDVESNPGPASDRTHLEKVVRKLSEDLRFNLPVDGSLWSESVAEAAYAAGYSPDCNWTNPSGKNKDSASRLVARAAELGRLLASMECLSQDLDPLVFDLDKNENLEKLKTYHVIENCKKAVEDLLDLDINTLTAAQTDTIQQLTSRLEKKQKEVNQQHKLHLPDGLSENSPASEFAELADSNPLQFDDPKEQPMSCVSPATTVTSRLENVLSHAGQNGESGKSSVESFEVENLAIEDIECTDFSGLVTYVDGDYKQIQKLLGDDDIKSKSPLAISQIPTNSTTTNTESLAQKSDQTGFNNACLLGNKYYQHYQHNNENNPAETQVDDNSNSTTKYINQTRSTQELNPVSQLNSKQDNLVDDVPTISETNYPSVYDTYDIDGPSLQIPGRVNNRINHDPDLTERIKETVIDTINFERIIGMGINTSNSATSTVTDASERFRERGIYTSKLVRHTVTDASERISRTGINTQISATHTVTDASERIREREINTPNSAMHTVTDASERIRETENNTSNSVLHTVTDASERISGRGINTQILATYTVTDASKRTRETEINTSNSTTHTITDASERISGTRINSSNSATHTVTDASGGITGPGIDTINSATQTVNGEDSHNYPPESVDENASMSVSLSDYIPHDTPKLHGQTLSAGGRYHKQSLKELKSSILEELGHLIDRRLELIPLETQITSSGCSIKPKCGHSSQNKEDANEDTKQRRFTDSSVGMTYSGKRKLRHSDRHTKKMKDN